MSGGGGAEAVGSPLPTKTVVSPGGGIQQGKPAMVAVSSSPKNLKQAPFWVSFVAGGVSGTIGAIITCPLEVVKTRLQSSIYQASPAEAVAISFRAAPLRAAWSHLLGTGQALRVIYTAEGVGALWKGVGAMVVGVMPSRAIYFSVYSKSKAILTDLNGGKEAPLVHLGSAAAAGVTTATATNPIWVIKTRMQLQSSATIAAATKAVHYRNSLDCLRVVVREEGMGALYKGMTASYMGVAEGTIQWVLYERLKSSLTAHRLRQMGLDPLAGTDSSPPPRPSDVLGWLDYFAVAASAKLVAAVAAYPHEVIRTRLREDHSKYRGLWQTAARIYREEGMGALYGGMTAHLLRVVPNSAIMFFCYEFIMHTYQKIAIARHEEQQQQQQRLVSSSTA